MLQQVCWSRSLGLLSPLRWLCWPVALHYFDPRSLSLIWSSDLLRIWSDTWGLHQKNLNKQRWLWRIKAKVAPTCSLQLVPSRGSRRHLVVGHMPGRFSIRKWFLPWTSGSLASSSLERMEINENRLKSIWTGRGSPIGRSFGPLPLVAAHLQCGIYLLACKYYKYIAKGNSLHIIVRFWCKKQRPSQRG